MNKIVLLLLLASLAGCSRLNPSPDEIPEDAKPLVGAAIRELAGRIGISSDAIKVVSLHRKTWSDASLGCATGGGFYAQVRTSGYRIVLRAGDKSFAYHAADGGQTVLFCESDPP